MKSKYTVLYKEHPTDKVWWVDKHDVNGQFLFTFDQRIVYNLFTDYPDKLTVEEWMIFNKENPHWVEFFKDRNLKYGADHAKEIGEYYGE